MGAGSFEGGRRSACYLVIGALALFSLPDRALGQTAQGTVRVPTSHANVHMGAGSGQQVLWLAPQGTVLNVVDRRGMWIAVRLTPEMRQTGMLMRWYRNENQGWMHESTVEFINR